MIANPYDSFYTGGEEYYIRFSNGAHELRMITDDEESYYEVVFTGHIDQCINKMTEIIADNVDYDYNL